MIISMLTGLGGHYIARRIIGVRTKKRLCMPDNYETIEAYKK